MPGGAAVADANACRAVRYWSAGPSGLLLGLRLGGARNGESPAMLAPVGVMNVGSVRG